MPLFNPTTSSEISGGAHFTVLPWNYSVIVQGTWVFASAAAQWGAFVYSNNSGTPANGDELDFLVYLPAGTYTLRFFNTTGATAAIISFDIDAALAVASFDAYSAGNVFNVLFTQIGIVLSTAGIKTIKVRVNGRNASSTGWLNQFSCFTFWRTA